ncbi:MAG TPA: S-layer homology domain-containing protein, partial [Chloroflexia bacterium]|nr:S-layer homology domain-containing protein [Chloroflexia bacterium]
GDNNLYGVAAVAANDVWAVGYWANGQSPQTLVEHWNGSTWSVVASPNVGTGDNNLYGVAAVAANDVWAVGDYFNGSNVLQTLMEHWNGSAWSVVPSPNVGTGDNNPYGVAAGGANDVWVVGYWANGSNVPQTLVEHWNGSTWSVVASLNVGTSANYLAGVAGGANDVWAVGEYGPIQGHQTLVEHWNGSAWSVVASPNVGTGDNALAGVAAVGANDVWAVGDSYNGSNNRTLMEHWNGSAWSVVASPNVGTSANYLAGVAAAGTNDVWAAGFYRNASGGYQTLTEHYTNLCVTPIPTNTPGPSPTPTPCSISFSDVHATDYFYTPVLDLACHGVISGYADGTFRPYNQTTRAQMVKIVVLGFNKPIVTPAGGNYSFADVPPTNPFFAVIETAAADSIVSGYACGGPGEPCDSRNRPYFRPNAYVTRGQLSKIDVVAAAWALRTPASGTFEDVAPGSAFYPFVETAACHGVVSGYACGGAGEPCDSTNRPYFRQYNNATRGQIAKIVDLSLSAGGACPPAAPR